MKEEEMNLENLKSKIKKFKWANRIMIIATLLLFSISTYRMVNFNDGFYLLGITISLLLPATIIAISILHNKIYKLELTANKLTSDKMRMNNILNDVELMKKIKENLKEDEEHRN